MLLEFQRAWACREQARDEPFGRLDVRVRMGGVPRVKVTLGSGMGRTAAPPVARQTAPLHAVSARVNERATSGRPRHGARCR